MSNSISFHDMPGNIKVENGVVHIDLYDKQPGNAAQPGEQPSYVFGERLVLSLPAFLQMFQMMSQVAAKLEAEGVLRRVPGDQPDGSAPAAGGTAAN
ncbi:MAG: hypothetical protein Q4F72_04255 [Desulfovibrionaceae bacterium]|nr:hypothetical protein [Desulfovibrionaceae bacterium]